MDETLPGFDAQGIKFALVDNDAYISFDIDWIRIQFKVNDWNATLSVRVKYGLNPPGDWKILTSNQ